MFLRSVEWTGKPLAYEIYIFTETFIVINVIIKLLLLLFIYSRLAEEVQKKDCLQMTSTAREGKGVMLKLTLLVRERGEWHYGCRQPIFKPLISLMKQKFIMKICCCVKLSVQNFTSPKWLFNNDFDNDVKFLQILFKPHCHHRNLSNITAQFKRRFNVSSY